MYVYMYIVTQQIAWVDLVGVVVGSPEILYNVLYTHMDLSGPKFKSHNGTYCLCHPEQFSSMGFKVLICKMGVIVLLSERS